MQSINDTIHGLCGAMALTGLIYGSLGVVSLVVNIFKTKSNADQSN